ncbi:hypothetical protein [uncultured Dokdonia sp.]|uniref:hypothetical protein n=1 Tax=uncultured Dokdonia sp. TaxID=575653 RepID=UPI002632E9F9|nr:hypothetical protein [uncultured Dokdonia sp.]
MKKQQKSIDLKKMTISKIQTDDLTSIHGGNMNPSLEPVKDYLITWLVACN